jgi:hypothetical protein
MSFFVLHIVTVRIGSLVVAVLLVVIGPAGRSDHDQQHCYHHAPTVKLGAAAAAAVVVLLMMGMKMPETC